MSYPNKAPFPNEPSCPNEPVTDNHIQQPSLPQSGDATLTRGKAYRDSAELVVIESFPAQIMLRLKGALPTPCNKLRVDINPPVKHNQIQVDDYSVIDPAQVCIQVLESFEANIG